MFPFPARLVAALLVGALTGCQAVAPPAFRGATMVFDRPRLRRAAAKTSGRFLEPAAALATAVGPVAADPAVRGRVVGLDAGGESPLAGALVSTSDGRAGLTGPDGEFAIPGPWPADGGLVASRDGYVASAVAGLAAGGETVLHLRGRSRLREGAAAAAEAPFTVTGRVVDASGGPLADALVVLEDARGAFSAPVTTAADGRFNLVVFAPGRAVEAATILAVSLGEADWLGARAGIVASPEAGDVGDVGVIAGERTLAVAVDAAALPGVPARTELKLVTADGASLALPAREGGYRVAELPEAHYELRVEAEDVGRGTASVFHRVVDASAGRVEASLLAPPGAELDPVLALNEALEWRDVPGNRGYQVTLAAIGGAGFLWEGFTAAPAMPFSFQAFLPDGLYGLTITAWDAAGLSPREVMAAGPRALRLPAEGADWRRASRQFRVTL